MPDWRGYHEANTVLFSSLSEDRFVSTVSGLTHRAQFDGINTRKRTAGGTPAGDGAHPREGEL